MVAHGIVGRVHAQAVPGGEIARDCRFAGTAASTDPIDMVQSCAQRGCGTRLLVFVGTHSTKLSIDADNAHTMMPHTALTEPAGVGAADSETDCAPGHPLPPS
ncbi:hypothetical protein [Nocardia gipuzkoensis]